MSRFQVSVHHLIIKLKMCFDNMSVVGRRPARYPPVQEWCDQLFRAVRMMPVSGHLLTAIWPLFPFFIAGIVSVQESHKDFIRSIYAIFCTIARGVGDLRFCCISC
jgi:hypothetical protein